MTAPFPAPGQLPVGNYTGRIVSVERWLPPDDGKKPKFPPKLDRNGKPIKKVCFTFESNSPEHEGLVATRIFNWTWSPQGALRPFVEKLIGRQLRRDEQFSLRSVIGKACDFEVEPGQGDDNVRVGRAVLTEAIPF